MRNGELSLEARNRIHIEWRGCSLVRDTKRTIIMFLQNALDGVDVVRVEGAVVS